MNTSEQFIAIDRRLALVNGSSMPEHVHGAALFADLSGFTPLTAELATALSPQRGAEELNLLLNRIYSDLTAVIDRYRGSVIGFAGDAFFCWFDSDDGLRATTCATELQRAMQAYTAITIAGVQASIAIKVALNVGSARRFLVGDPQVRVVDILAGSMVDQLAAAEQQAQSGDIILASAAVTALADRISVAEWREGDVAVLAALHDQAQADPWPLLPQLPSEVARPWLIPAVYERLRGGYGLLQRELRTAVALFLGFGDLDYDHDAEAGQRLDDYIRWVQRVLERYAGVLIDITMGEKGGYMHIEFGVPLAQGDDATRAAAAALELRSPPPELSFITRTQIGMSVGLVLSGIYGGSTLTYSALGNSTNLAARLMQRAKPGQIIANARLMADLERRYVLQPLPAIELKGRRDPQAIMLVAGERAAPGERLNAARYTLPLIGRKRELAQLEAALANALIWHGQAVGLTGDAGLGKSRLVADLIRRAAATGVTCLTGEAPSHGSSVSYLAWRPIWRELFGINPEAPFDQQIEQLAGTLDGFGPSFRARMPLLNVVLDLPIPEHDFTRSLNPRIRKEATEALLVESVRVRARRTPLLLVLEDAHWLDQLSLELLSVVARNISDLPILLLLAYRPIESEPSGIDLNAIAEWNLIPLSELDDEAAIDLVTQKHATLFGANQPIADSLIERITTLAQGNPFYIEELLNYIQDCGIAPDDEEAIQQLDLPASLSQLLLSRIDRLTSDQQTTLKVASVVGRLFAVAWLRGAYPELGSEDRVRYDLATLARLDLTMVHTEDPELYYLFKHAITQEVIYESLPFRIRSQLHNQLGVWLEQTQPTNPPLDLLAFHYGRSSNTAKQREYYRRAGQAAAEHYANTAAIRYYTALLEIVDTPEHAAIELEIGLVYAVIGEWDEAERRYQRALDGFPEQSILRGRTLLALGSLLWSRGRYDDSFRVLNEAQALFSALNESTLLVRTLNEIAALARLRGEYDLAVAKLLEAQQHAQAANDRPGLARVLHILGNLGSMRNDYTAARDYSLQALTIRRELGDRYEAALSINNVGIALFNLGDADSALSLVQEAYETLRDLGVRRPAAIAQMGLGRIQTARGQHLRARELLLNALNDFEALKAYWEIGTALARLAAATWNPGEPAEQLERALQLCGAAEGVLKRIGAVFQPYDRAIVDQCLQAARSILGEERAEQLHQQSLELSVAEALLLARTAA
ncbi:MAG: adenylate/guanylate cyclase domain-containing protein [Roseiflexaceae bacterium]